jgi:hypothetical protein
MTRIKQFGPSILEANLGARLVRANMVPRSATPPIQWRKFCKNGDAPSAQFVNLLHEATNQAVVHRTRQLFWAAGAKSMLASTSSSRARYRFAFRTSTYMHSLMAFVTMQPPTSANGGLNSYVRLKVFSDTAEATAVATVDFYYGSSPLGTAALGITGWSVAKTVALPVTGLSPNTDYYGTFYDEQGCRLQTATVIEMQSMTEGNDGYLPQSLNQDSEVLSVYRQEVATIQKQLWKYSGAHVFNWTVDDGSTPLTFNGIAATNIIDQSSTTISANTPGLTLDMRHKDRLMQPSGVPVIMKVFADEPYGTVYLKDSAGATVASLTGWGATPSWRSVTFNLPATLAKYDLHAAENLGAGDGTTPFHLYAAACWEYEA